MMNTWISIREAAELTGKSIKGIFEHIRRDHLEIKHVPCGGHRPHTYVKRADFDHLPTKRKQWQPDRNAHTSYARQLVAWADSLTQWPSDDEIHKREHGPYQYKDIVSVLETRVYRKKQALRISDERREKVYSGGENDGRGT
jgi:hypothetical protein